ncbi:Oxygen-evolving enhancer protein 3-2, chloroplastic [Trifolium repens]|nr:psbQ protein 3, chloroplastic [Trifolium repens]WJX91563.1 Oxygen-evolving enhancer protein 3-2, chloroplastic [Trifolium repens]
MALMAGCQAVLEGSLQLSGSNRFSSSNKVVTTRSSVSVRAQQQQESSRRAVIGLVATGLVSSSFVQAVLAEAIPIKVGGPPAPSGGLPGTLNSDEARDLKLPLKERFYLQPLTPTEAAARAKESAKEIVAAKKFIDQKAWPYLQNDLRLRAGYLRYDLNTIISSKPKDQKQSLKELTGKLFQDIDNLDYAAKQKSPSDAEKYYAIAVSTLNDVLSKIG